jgi:NAD+ diphosphatase
METGETAEHAVRRELMEETGIKVKNIQYFGTQSWPFPSQLMIAFTAEWESGEPQPQDGELADIGWFLPGECPNTPQPGSIAYRMIQSFKEGKGAGKACESKGRF